MVAPLKASLCFVTPEGDRWRRRGLGTHASYSTNYTRKHKKGGVGNPPRSSVYSVCSVSRTKERRFIYSVSWVFPFLPMLYFCSSTQSDLSL